MFIENLPCDGTMYAQCFACAVSFSLFQTLVDGSCVFLLRVKVKLLVQDSQLTVRK